MDNNLTFCEALGELQGGGKIYRKGWTGKEMWLETQKPDKNSKMSLPYIYIQMEGADLAPWLASQDDILSNDWLKYISE